jgi:acylphosphatase
MRWWVRSRALEAGLTGWARNLDDGRVEVVAQGPEAKCRGLLEQLQSGAIGGGRPGRIDAVVERWSVANGSLGAADGTFEER